MGSRISFRDIDYGQDQDRYNQHLWFLDEQRMRHGEFASTHGRARGPGFMKRTVRRRRRVGSTPRTARRSQRDEKEEKAYAFIAKTYAMISALDGAVGGWSESSWAMVIFAIRKSSRPRSSPSTSGTTTS